MWLSWSIVPLLSLLSLDQCSGFHNSKDPPLWHRCIEVGRGLNRERRARIWQISSNPQPSTWPLLSLPALSDLTTFMLRMRSCAFDLVLSSGSGPLGEALYFTGWFPLRFRNSWLAYFCLFGYSSCPLVMNPRPPRRWVATLPVESSFNWFKWFSQ